MSLISPNFDIKSIIFPPILARGFFPKLLEKALKFCNGSVASENNFWLTCLIFQTGDVKELPTSQQIEKQKVVLEQLTNTLDLPIDKLPALR